MSTAPLDPVALAQAMIRRPSVTPEDAGCLAVLRAALEPLGFVCEVHRFAAPGTAPVDNLWAKWGAGRPHLCFAGHSDVVPPGAAAAWSIDPFAGEVRDGQLLGRGAADMKGAIAAFVAAAAGFIARRPDFPGALSLLITGDEEGPAINGTKPMLELLAARGERIDHCLVGEPTNPAALGDMIKIGRRGSLNLVLTALGTQGHVAYPERARNPIRGLMRLLAALTEPPLDAGTPLFQPSNLEPTSVDVGNAATNVIPGAATARLNVRFNDLWTGASLEAELRRRLDAAEFPYRLEATCSGEAFAFPPGPFVGLIADAAAAETGRRPELSTTGGTSDARFIRAYCPVAEFGLVGATMHQADERTAVADILTLARIYGRVLDSYADAMGMEQAA